MSDMFDLNALVKDVCDTSSLTNDDELTKEVLSRIAPADERAALEEALPVYVRRFVSRDHRPLSAPQSSATDQSSCDTHNSVVGGGAVPFRSRKVSAIRSWAQQWEDQKKARMNVGHKQRKFWGDCTLDDLAFISKQNRKLAAANIVNADYQDLVAGLMRKYDAETVGDLPQDAVRELMEAAA